MQVSVDGENFVDYASFTPITVFSANSIFFLDNKMFPFKASRLVYTATSGAGTVDVWIDGVRI